METKEMIDILRKYKDSGVSLKKYSIANEIALRLEYLQTELDAALAKIDKAVDIAEANIRAEIASGGTSCHWCENIIRKKTTEIFAERTKEKCKDLFSGADVCIIVDQIQKEMLEELNG